MQMQTGTQVQTSSQEQPPPLELPEEPDPLVGGREPVMTGSSPAKVPGTQSQVQIAPAGMGAPQGNV